MLVPRLALVDLEVLGKRAGVPERVVGRGSKQAHVHATRAADLVLAFGGLFEPVLCATLAALLPRDALILRGVGVRVRVRGRGRVRDRVRVS